MTPSVARMIAANAGRLSFPVRWYSHPNCHRYERPQKGRVREHWQINVDVFGSESVEAEVEIFELIHRMMKALGAAPSQWELRVNDRVLIFSAVKTFCGVPPEQVGAVLRVLDRWEKVPREKSVEALGAIGLPAAAIDRVVELTGRDFAGFRDAADPADLARSPLTAIFENELLDVPVAFHPLIVRGLDYYTSTVFEVFDTDPENRRSIFGGGRYGDLASLFSKQRIPGIGFGMGDVTLMDFLAGHGLLPEPDVHPHVVVLPLEPATRAALKDVARVLRDAKLRVVTPLEEAALGKDLKKAAKRGARVAVIVPADGGPLVVRDLVRSTQQEVAPVAPVASDALLAAVRAALESRA
jgi:histidyl-tRNA synthetase